MIGTAPGNPAVNAFPKFIHGKTISMGIFRFQCGFDVPASQIEWLAGIDTPLNPGDEVQLRIEQVNVTRAHTHQYKCTTCGQMECHR